MMVLVLILGLILGVLLTVPGAVASDRTVRAALDAERRRTDELLRLLEAKAAPTEFGAYVAPAPYDPGTWLFSDDGLVAVPLDDEDN